MKASEILAKRKQEKAQADQDYQAKNIINSLSETDSIIYDYLISEGLSTEYILPQVNPKDVLARIDYRRPIHIDIFNKDRELFLDLIGKEDCTFQLYLGLSSQSYRRERYTLEDKSTTLDGLVGNTILAAKEYNDDELYFYFKDFVTVFYHNQSCCEHVYIEDICGDLSDLVGSPLIICEDVSSEAPEDSEDGGQVTEWTFYRFATVKGTVTVRWCGTSNGYYSTSVDVSHFYYNKT